MDEKEIITSEHAAKSLYKFSFNIAELQRAICEGERITEGKNKARYRLQTKKGLLIAICKEYPDQILVITVTKRR